MVGGINIAVYLLFRGTRHNKDQSIIACSVLFRGLTAAIYKVWAARIFKCGVLKYLVKLNYKSKNNIDRQIGWPLIYAIYLF